MNTTSMIDIRDFLTTHGCMPAPWESTQGVIDRFYLALSERHDDRVFWSDLKDLVSRLRDPNFNQAAMRGSQALSDIKLGKLIDELSLAVDQERISVKSIAARKTTDKDGTLVRRWVSHSITAAALLAFLLLFSATGCTGCAKQDKDADSNGDNDAQVDDDNSTADDDIQDDDASPQDDDATPQDDDATPQDDDATPQDDDSTPADDDAVALHLCEEAAEHNFTGHNGEVYCELVDIILSADIDESIKQTLLDCLPYLSPYYREQLLDMLDSMSEEAINAYLEDNYTDICNYYPDDDH